MKQHKEKKMICTHEVKLAYIEGINNGHICSDTLRTNMKESIDHYEESNGKDWQK